MLATRDEVKTYLGISGSSEDALIDQLLAGTDAWIKRYLGRDIEAANYIEQVDGSGAPIQILKQYPIISVTSVYDDTARAFGSDTLLVENTDFLVYKEEGYLEIIDGGDFVEGQKNVKVSYRAGYETADIPKDLKQAEIELVANEYRRKETEGVKAMTVGAFSVSYDSTETMPSEIKAVLDSYKKVRLA